MTETTRYTTADSLIRRLNAMVPQAASPVVVWPAELFHRQVRSRVHATGPAFFEKLILDLLLAMGYGPRAILLGKTGDGGVDGLLSRDPLCLEPVYFQAKRYRLEDTAAVSHVRDFAGSLDAHRATKGIFVTTANISKASHEFAKLFSRKIVLTDGARLAALLIENKIGIRVREVQEVLEVDEAYFSGKRMTETISASIQPLK